MNTLYNCRSARHRTWGSTSWRHVIFHLATWSSARGLWLWGPSYIVRSRCVWGATSLPVMTASIGVPNAYGRVADQAVLQTPSCTPQSVPYWVYRQSKTWRRWPEKTLVSTIMTPWRRLDVYCCSDVTPASGVRFCRWKHISGTGDPVLTPTGTVELETKY
jgi:hypothetical protein